MKLIGTHLSGAMLLVLLCGANNSISHAGNPDDAKDLAELERQIQAKEKELAGLRRTADALRAKLEAGKKRAEGKAFTSAEQVVAGLPRDKHPKFGADGAPERKAANAWLKENVVGKAVELMVTIMEVRLSESDDQYSVQVGFKWKSTDRFGIPTLGQVKLGEESIQVSVGGDDVTRPTIVAKSWLLGNPPYVQCTVDEGLAKKLRDLKGMEVTFQGRLVVAQFDQNGKRRYLRLHVVPVSLAGLKLP